MLIVVLLLLFNTNDNKHTVYFANAGRCCLAGEFTQTIAFVLIEKQVLAAVAFCCCLIAHSCCYCHCCYCLVVTVIVVIVTTMTVTTMTTMTTTIKTTKPQHKLQRNKKSQDEAWPNSMYEIWPSLFRSKQCFHAAVIVPYLLRSNRFSPCRSITSFPLCIAS